MTVETGPEDQSAIERPAERLYIPILITVSALFLMVAFQTVQLWRERGALATLKTAQEASIQEGQRLRQQLDGIAGPTARLAADGHPIARAIVEDLRRQGVTISPGTKP